jgi:hypothetical protein
VSFFDEVTTWGKRLFELLPEIMGLWSAVKDGESKERLDAQLALERKISDMQAKEELG